MNFLYGLGVGAIAAIFNRGLVNTYMSCYEKVNAPEPLTNGQIAMGYLSYWFFALIQPILAVFGVLTFLTAVIKYNPTATKWFRKLGIIL